MSNRTGRGNPDRGGINPPQRDIEDLLRKAVNLVRHGVVEEVDHGRRMARIRIGDPAVENASYLTNWLRISSDRAGTTSMSRQLSKGEQVMVFSPDGRTENGVIGASIHSQGNESPSDRGDLGRTIYPDGAIVGYDDGSGSFLVSVPSGQLLLRVSGVSVGLTDSAVSVQGGDEFLVEAGGCTLRMSGGNVDIVSGGLTHNGKNVGDTHVHINVRSGPDNTGVPA